MPNKVEAKMGEKTTNWETFEPDSVLCMGNPCKRANVYIMSADEMVTIVGMDYHKGCEPPLD